MQLEPNQRFYYIQLLKDQQQLIEIGHDLLNVNCYNFLKVSTQLLVRLDTLHLQQLFTYYLLNFDPQLDSHHRCINLSRFIFKIAQQLQIENYVFLGVQCPSQVSHFVQKAFNFKNLDMILKSIFVVQQLQQIPQSLDYTAIVSFYYTQSVIQRPESSDNLDDFIPDIPNFSYDAENINAILPFSISPSLTEPAIQNQNIVAYFFHYLKSIIQLEISDELNRKFILYLFTVKIYPTLTFFSQFLKPCPGLKKIVKIALYKDGFSLRRKSAVAQKVFSLIYTQKEIENFYDQTSIQMVNIAAQYTPYQDITQNLDQYWVRRCAFAGALATNQDIQQDVFTDKNIQLEFIFIPTKITGTVAKLIILKHTKISVQYIDKVNIFLLNCCNEQITQWEQWQLVILGCQCLVFQNPIIKYEQLRALIKLDRQKWFDKAIYKLWGLSQQSLESMNSNQSIITSQ
ncbi:hypothetical protein SS50377_23390 [Spironucleus salmonicida]|uniref:Uncharacterized protein n=1 Tax=Spironucleus salmonicida TaxID=348837 RepID=V6LU84_9EUKA|nr:hypothetical protein SS50377_23390 [Spironucleus salmonicida]|eukprot:EST47261.1 Hypothetical protein SS50377_12771 [Spironucleus salmonicida]